MTDLAPHRAPPYGGDGGFLSGIPMAQNNCTIGIWHFPHRTPPRLSEAAYGWYFKLFGSLKKVDQV